MVYIGVAFVLFPSLLFLCSFLIPLGIIGIILNIILDAVLVSLLVSFIKYFDTVNEIVQSVWAQISVVWQEKVGNSAFASRFPSFSLQSKSEPEERTSGGLSMGEVR